ncbi:hypothetical protein KQ939_15930 [Planococcus sp. CP5-4]|uniref:hypothetical protein n=1 Tax=unclassified Planococcus (in: firmicutes) TaxID=2662419 RepID=UPI001C22150B|nr:MULTISPECIES: hypothetical protein [unclassified Planococcus (in: firmicutes)]MBU9674575.1 hypothetical protein [Planococcus sp. CP5-4_YE]MBV0910315.1 hypothetical protein [Planococcus sp. CP5-4_UN]MBW6065166.1 hypothetical protein [Planococcus sp. CP5-4]
MQDWKAEEQKLYIPATEAHTVHIPKQFYFVIDGRESLGSEDFHERLRVLTALSEAVRTIPQFGHCPPGFAEYSLYPLETLHHAESPDGLSATFSLMIRQPDFIDNETIDRAFNLIHKERKFPLLPEVAFEELEDGLSVQLRSAQNLEPSVEAFSKIDRFLLANALKRRNSQHREIYPGHERALFDEVVYRVFVEEAQ